MSNNIRYAVRTLRHSPGFALTALIERVSYVPERMLIRDLLPG